MLVVGAAMSTSKLVGGAATEAEADGVGAEAEAEAAGLSVLEDDDGTTAWTGLPRR